MAVQRIGGIPNSLDANQQQPCILEPIRKGSEPLRRGSAHFQSSELHAMPFHFTCPYCYKKTLVSESLAGQQGPCVGCGKMIHIPDPPRKQPETVRPVDSTFVPPEMIRPKSNAMLLTIRGFGLLIAVGLAGLFAVYGFWPSVKGLKARRDAITCMGNLQQLADALNEYARLHGSYPTPVVTDGKGKPLYSWRVLILPQLNEDSLYSQFHLDEPWDSTHNAQLIAQCPLQFISPASTSRINAAESSYVLLTGRGTIFPPSGPLQPNNLTDGAGKTLLIVETDNGVHEWSKPFDIDVTKFTGPIGTLGTGSIGGTHDGGATAVMADGTAVWLPADLPQAVLDAAITPKGGESIVIDPDELQYR